MHLDRTRRLALVGAAAVLAAAAIILARPDGDRASLPVPVATPAPLEQIKVDVVGEVIWPGLYILNAGARVQDAVFAAHGPTYVADLRRVNLAAVLRDGDRVVIPRIIQPAYPFRDAPMSADLDHPSATPRRSSKGSQAGEAPAAVNVNTATAADFARLPGVGPVLARRIVEHREARGLFRRLDDLLEVDGIGPKLLRRLEPLLRLDEGTAPMPPP
jgi:competence protein ComEA